MNVSRRARAFLALLLPLLVAGSARAADRALLVGVDVYQDARVPATPGAVDDARSVAEVLVTRFGFPREDVRLLVNNEATAAAIAREFTTWLIEGTAPGDRVFFLYAGHGSQLRDDGGDEDDRLDETLAPYDVDPTTGEREIRDDLLDALIAQLSGRRAVLLFDSCHSGTVTRGFPGGGGGPARPGARYLPSPEQFREVWKEGGDYLTRSGRAEYTVVPDPATGDKRVVDNPGKAGKLAGIVAIAAARPGQLAYPLEVEGRYRGALSYLFEQLYSDGAASRNLLGDLRKKAVGTVGATAKQTASAAVTGGGGAAVAGAVEGGKDALTVGMLQTAIDTGIKRLQTSGRLEGNQEPWFEVISEVPIDQEPLFGTWQQATAVAISNPVSQAQVALRTLDGRSTFKSGEKLGFEVSSDRGGYLYLLVFSRERVATCIFPNPNDSANQISAGKKLLPGSDAYVFPVTEPYGRDVVVALVSEQRLRLCEKVNYGWDEVLERIDLRSAHEALREQSLRGVGVEPAAAAGAAASPLWQAASLVLETSP